jgi:SAM-dependent methyltransferase
MNICFFPGDQADRSYGFGSRIVMQNKKPGRDFPYNGAVAQWWYKHACDRAHARAYRKIADYIRDSYTQDPKLIVDYACGAGNLLFLLSSRFPYSKLIGLDGSAFLLQRARRRLSRLPPACARRMSFIETSLPNMDIIRGKAALAIYCFPNMVAASGTERFLNKNDRHVARYLSLDEDVDDSPAVQSGMEQGRVISLNLRRILMRGGICMRVEYATLQRHELSPPELAMVSFEEGSLDERVEGLISSLWFRVSASSYFRSRVLEDVYEQTADERDKKGGYLITVLTAV